jgi:hypothetical protein
MKSFDILVDVVSDTWLKSQFPRAPSHTKERAIGGVGGTGTDERGSRKERYIEAKQDSAERKEGRDDMTRR